MANEAQFSFTLNVNKRDADTGVQRIASPSQFGFSLTVDGNSGPYVGTVLATTGGTFVSLAGVGTPGLAVFHNQSTSEKVYVGTYDTTTGQFTPFLRLKPGMALPVYLPETLRDFSGTAAGTASVGSNLLMVKAHDASAPVDVKVFPE